MEKVKHGLVIIWLRFPAWIHCMLHNIKDKREKTMQDKKVKENLQEVIKQFGRLDGLKSQDAEMLRAIVVRVFGDVYGK